MLQIVFMATSSEGQHGFLEIAIPKHVCVCVYFKPHIAFNESQSTLVKIVNHGCRAHNIQSGGSVPGILTWENGCILHTVN